ncbi:MAG: hypothetical protein DIZ77_08035 [endosymbiont of Seepiophila jonesi]|uniref:Uncharacterized protein n=1 Tax=endosymbiont of Lamellibrachia luymesi TaxID=2200907 RepID=A0A370DZ41_9GAMM|nr:MAG: hypothetical protein DIZ79_05060 [endosymbiont of Lamellibrachia luymesi]RDH92585.1 MAG: hypothetical protein DIZ77_08035 [endosymbiont of Seepiophila jonesi]
MPDSLLGVTVLGQIAEADGIAGLEEMTRQLTDFYRLAQVGLQPGSVGSAILEILHADLVAEVGDAVAQIHTDAVLLQQI